MILDQSGIFTQSIQSNNTAIIPVVVFSKNNIDHYISTNAVTMDGNYYEPLLLNIPSIRESIDFEKRNFKISNISLSISNSVYNGDKRFSDNLPDIMNADCLIYYKTTVTQNLNDCLLVYNGKVKRMSHNETTISLQIEDLSQENLHKDLPTQTVDTNVEVLEKYRNKPVPFVYGETYKHKVVLNSIPESTDFEVLADTLELKNYRDIEPLKLLIEDKYAVLSNRADKSGFNFFTQGLDFQDNIQVEINDNIIKIKRMYGERNDILFGQDEEYTTDNPLNPIADDRGQVKIFDTPEISLDQNDQLVRKAFYVNGELFGTTTVQLDNVNLNLNNKENLYDTKKTNHFYVSSFDGDNEIDCRIFRESREVPSGGTYGSTWFDLRFISLKFKYNPMPESDLYTNLISYPKISLNLKKTFHSYDQTDHPDANVFPQIRVQIYKKSNRTEDDGFKNKTVVTNWNYDNDGEFNYNKNLNDIYPFNDFTIQGGLDIMTIQFIPENIIPLDVGNHINSVGLDTKFYCFDNVEFGVINKKLFDNDFYVDTNGRKGNAGEDYDLNYIRKTTIDTDQVAYAFSIKKLTALINKNPLLIEDLKVGDNIDVITTLNNEEIIINSNIENININEDDNIYEIFLQNDLNINDLAFDVNVGIVLNNNNIELPCDILRHLLINDIGFDVDKIKQNELEIAREESNGFYFSISQTEKINSKKFIENIAKQSKFFPKFRNDGTFGFNTIKDQYSDEDAEIIEIRDIINYKFDRTKIDDIKTKIKIIYGKDNITGDYLKATDYMTASEYFSGYDNAYMGLEEDHRTSTLDLEAEYIQQEQTANLLRNFLLSWYANQHNIITVDLPLRYLKFEVGDVVKFDGLINNLKLYGEDYTIINNRNGQDIYPYFMIMETVKNINKITFKLLQLHKNLPVEQQDDIQTELNRSGMKIPLEQEIDKVLKPTNIIPTDDVIPRTESQDDDGQDVGSGGRGGGGY